MEVLDGGSFASLCNVNSFDHDRFMTNNGEYDPQVNQWIVNADQTEQIPIGFLLQKTRAFLTRDAQVYTDKPHKGTPTTGLDLVKGRRDYLSGLCKKLSDCSHWKLDGTMIRGTCPEWTEAYNRTNPDWAPNIRSTSHGEANMFYAIPHNRGEYKEYINIEQPVLQQYVAPYAPYGRKEQYIPMFIWDICCIYTLEWTDDGYYDVIVGTSCGVGNPSLTLSGDWNLNPQITCNFARYICDAESLSHGQMLGYRQMEPWQYSFFLYPERAEGAITIKQYMDALIPYWRTMPVYPGYRHKCYHPSGVDSTESIIKGMQIHGTFAKLAEIHLDNESKRRLATRAYSSIAWYEGNGLAELKELVGLKSSISDTFASLRVLKKLALKTKTGKILLAAGTAANLFLSFHWGYKLTLEDAKEMVDVATRYLSVFNTYQKCRASTRVGVYTSSEDEDYTYWSTHHWGAPDIALQASYEVYYKRFEKLSLHVAKIADLFDLIPDWSSVNDMVPYSFVLGWFTNLNDLLEGLDQYLDLQQKHKVLAVGYTEKASTHVGLSNLNANIDASQALCSPLTASVYNRRYNMDLIKPFDKVELVNNFNVKHGIESGALIVQRLN